MENCLVDYLKVVDEESGISLLHASATLGLVQDMEKLIACGAEVNMLKVHY